MPQDIAQLAQSVVADNIAAGRTVALAESCTGGMVAAAITDVPGASAMFAASLVTYANEAKQALLGVDPVIIADNGAVSAECARAMALGALRRTGADVAVAITGVAGPDGGSEAKPVGTVMFARATGTRDAEQCVTLRRNYPADAGREVIRQLATSTALQLLLPGDNGDQAGP